MQFTTTRLFPFAVALAVAINQIQATACDHCGDALAISCIDERILDGFQVGGGDEPAAYRTQGSGWSTTSGGSSPFGEQAILTWSMVRDGTTLPQGVGEPSSPSNLIAFLDGIHHGGPGPGGNDLTQRDWFPLVKSAFDRWDAVSAIRFSFESNDDGVHLGSSAGILGVRGDHRLGGHSIDGTTSPTTVAYNFFPQNADMVIDTDEVGRMGNPGLNYVRFRNTLMHEIGHGLGLNHLASTGNNFLMEATLDATIDGPQFDDILGIHRLYGDRFEELGGNDTPAISTNLGSLLVGQAFALGADANDAVVSPTDVDFVSINMTADVDYFRFTANAAGTLNIVLTPMGSSYQEGPQGGTQTAFHAAAQNDLSLFLYDSTGVNLLALSAGAGMGLPENILGFSVPAASNYMVRVAGAQDIAQFYQLDIALLPEPAAALLVMLGSVVLAGQRPRSRN
jgi:serralysin